MNLIEETLKKMKDKVEIFKALSDSNRLLILEMLSCGEMCACEFIDGLGISQPTVSHHMKILQQAGLIKGEKRGKWMYYSIRDEKIEEICDFIKSFNSDKEECICKKINKKSCCD